jgi:integrase
MKKTTTEAKKPWHKKPAFGSLYTMQGSRFIYISMNYFKQRLRFPTDREDTPENWDELSDFMRDVGRKIKNRTFCFAKAFYWADEATKQHFSRLEGRDYRPEPEHVMFGDFAIEWMARKFPAFYSVTKREYYAKALNSRILPFFGDMTFAEITPLTVEEFMNSLKRSNDTGLPLTVKRIKNIVTPMGVVWRAACAQNRWSIVDPFLNVKDLYKELEDKELAHKNRLKQLSGGNNNKATTAKRDVFLFAEWLKLREAIDPHYHLVLELLLRGVIGSEMEGLQKCDIVADTIKLQRVVVHEKGGKVHLKFKLKNWYRERGIPITAMMKPLVAHAVATSTSTGMISFEDGLTLPAANFLLTMKDGSPFNYDSFRDSVWNKAIRQTGLARRVPYASRHTFAQWGLMVGVDKGRMVDLMGHSTKKMVYEKYGKYRDGLVNEREMILDYLGEDFLEPEELKNSFPERYRRNMAQEGAVPRIATAPDLAIAVGQSFGQSQGLYADNYM